ncbi:MAG TPA: HAMP domain-containing sensor histidine kinase, partial [Allocoleopsis sp.]
IMKDLPQMINSMKSGAERLVTIVGSLQNFSRMDEKTPVPTNLHECIEGTLLILNNRLKGITVIKKYSDVPTINAFSGQLSQVFMNLISNAIEALMDKVQRLPNLNNWKPKIEIITKSIKQEDSKNYWICVSIIDNGDGMSKEVQSRIFEPFYTTKPVGKGTGLGLAISYQIVTEKHGGRILVNSKPQQGTGFDVFLPVI